MTRLSRAALFGLLALAAGGILAGGAQAQPLDLTPPATDQKDCCTNLDDRVSKLESEADRKGNHKVSVTVSGWLEETVGKASDGGSDEARPKQ